MDAPDDTIDALARLEVDARRLEPSAAEAADLLDAAVDHARDFLAGVATDPAWFPADGAPVRHEKFPAGGRPVGEVLAIVRDHVDRTGISTTSPRFFGYVPGGGLLPSAIGDLLASLANRYASVPYAGPGAARVEQACIDWMVDVLGFPATTAGHLSSGGSLANQTALVTARDAHGIDGAAIDDAVVYLTEHAHHCLDKALQLIGLRRVTVRRVPVDERHRMRADALAATVVRDLDEGLRPWLVVGSAGTTNTGSVDPLDALADVAEAHGLWFHVDGAYGGLYALCPEARPVLAGIERADSLVVDPHKTLFLPYGTGALLVRDGSLLAAAHGARAAYMQDVVDQEVIAAADVSPELSRNFRGLRMWLPLQLFGVDAFRAAMREKLLLARYAHGRLAAAGFAVGAEPDLGIVTFRHVPASGDADAHNAALADAVVRDGRIFLSTTQLEGRYTLRLAIGCVATHREHVDEAVDVLRELAAGLS